jgi:hypothetical protein
MKLRDRSVSCHTIISVPARVAEANTTMSLSHSNGLRATTVDEVHGSVAPRVAAGAVL